ncbi:TetR/AcrR family transcriptional regulator [Primorskyibacter sp. S187A]|uniref:TetR/AcrR family transcriptional regulator n=1 Tax=Primorskyibacter sp. S187A TaxID=3415130 RepID=UPI003C7BD4A4
MGRSDTDTKPLSRSQRRRRDDIVQAAVKIFDRDGFEAAKMEDIAREAEVAKGTLYLYFDTKNDLLEAVIFMAIMPTLQQMGQAAAESTGTARELLSQQMLIAAKRMASQLASFVRKSRTLIRSSSSGPMSTQPFGAFCSTICKSSISRRWSRTIWN